MPSRIASQGPRTSSRAVGFFQAEGPEAARPKVQGLLWPRLRSQTASRLLNSTEHKAVTRATPDSRGETDLSLPPLKVRNAKKILQANFETFTEIKELSFYD